MDKTKVKKIILCITVFWFLILMFFLMVFSSITINGHSMDYSYSNGENLWGLNYQLKNPFGNYYFGPHLFTVKRNDVLVIQSKNFAKMEQMQGKAPDPLIKRVIGMPKEQVGIINHAVFINGSPIKEAYQINGQNYDNYSGKTFTKKNPKYFINERMIRNNTPNENNTAIQLKKNQIFAMGDNRNFSNDSRVYGPFNINSEIQSKVVNIKLPISFVRFFLLLGLLILGILLITVEFL